MRRSIFRYLAGSLSIAAIGTGTWLVFTTPSWNGAEADIDDFETLDTRTSDQLIGTRLGPNGSADAVSREVAEEKVLLQRLRALATSARDPDLQRQVDKAEQWRVQREALSTAYSASSANMLDALEEIGPDDDKFDDAHADLRAVSAMLTHELFQFASTADPAARAKALKIMAALPAMAHSDPESADYLRVARNALASADKLEKLASQLLAIQAQAPYRSLHQEILRRISVSEQRALLAEGLLVLAGAAMLAAMAQATARLRGSERALLGAVGDLREKNEELGRAHTDLEQAAQLLESRVDLRTRELAGANQLLAQTNAQLVEASRAKGDFLANMSHELRTPLCAVQGFAELLLDPELGPRERREHVLTIRRNGDQLLHLIDDILDLTKIEAGRVVIDNVRCSPARLLLEVEALFQARATERGLDLAVDLQTPVPETIASDPTRIRQILLNLVGNAIKFTERGGVRVSASLLETTEPTLSFAIQDTGIGLTEAQIAHLFQPFVQADNSLTRRFGGTGLGLAICQRTAGLLGGHITVRSEPGKGSCFTFTLPTGPVAAIPRVDTLREAPSAPARNAGPGDRTALASCRVLLAEDGPDNQRLLSTLLRKDGASVEIVENGVLALAAILDAEAAGTPYDVVLMDMQMPELDGYGATARLRATGYRRPIIALTAHAMVGDRERCLDAGCDAYLTKPVQRATLIEAVSDWAHRAS